MNEPSDKPKVMNAKSSVMRPKFRSRVEKDRTKYNRKGRRKENDVDG